MGYDPMEGQEIELEFEFENGGLTMQNSQSRQCW